MNKSYVIRAGRYTTAQKKAYETLSEKFLLSFQLNSGEYINFEEVFGNANGVTLEIGFGMGITTAAIAEINPEKNYLGVEVHRPGVGRLLWEIENRSLSNIRIIEQDAVIVTEKILPPNSLEAIHVFFPDPWQKKRHRKRRLIQRPFTKTLSALLKPGGYFYMTTDWEDYAHHALEELTATDGLVNAWKDFAPPQDWRPVTKFEEKGLAKRHKIFELYFVKNNVENLSHRDTENTKNAEKSQE
ncbi:MAG: tRNA (guanosine(46)-N7)-methyltransferase TrmB [Treponema sp.]|jgi:tRNA (guanine-N7-)-methyltransferase|nr:tRNA (guanosine(46)-N7)-methyltransferase TrmB [Treponema sp.]